MTKTGFLGAEITKGLMDRRQDSETDLEIKPDSSGHWRLMENGAEKYFSKEGRK